MYLYVCVCACVRKCVGLCVFVCVHVYTFLQSRVCTGASNRYNICAECILGVLYICAYSITYISLSLSLSLNIFMIVVLCIWTYL